MGSTPDQSAQANEIALINEEDGNFAFMNTNSNGKNRTATAAARVSTPNGLQTGTRSKKGVFAKQDTVNSGSCFSRPAAKIASNVFVAEHPTETGAGGEGSPVGCCDVTDKLAETSPADDCSARGEAESSEDDDQDGPRIDAKSLLPVKAFLSMEEIPLLPVGLSLSRSGMELYVKVDKVRHMDQLGIIEETSTAKLTKSPRGPNKKKRESIRKRDAIEIRSQATKLPQPVVTDEKIGKFHLAPDPSSPVVPVSTPGHETGKRASKFPSMSKEAMSTTARDLQQPRLEEQGNVNSRFEAPNETVEKISLSTTTECDEQPAGSSRPFGVSHSNTGGIHRRKAPFHDKVDRWPQGSPAVLEMTNWVISDPPRKRPGTQPEDVEVATLTTEGQSGTSGSSSSSSGCSKKRPLPIIFTSSDLPLKRPSPATFYSRGDHLVPHHVTWNNSSAFSQDMPAQPGPSFASYPNYNLRNESGKGKVISLGKCGTNHEREISIDNIEEFQERYVSRGDIDNIHDQEITSHGTRVRESTDNVPAVEKDLTVKYLPSIAGPSRVNSPSPEGLNVGNDPEDLRADANVTPLPDDDFDPAQILATHGKLDAKTLARFTSYTKSMRRDLKQGYKRLSLLMKEFNSEVERELEREQSAQAPENSDTASESGNKCVIM